MKLSRLAYLSPHAALLAVILNASWALAATPVKIIIAGQGLDKAIEIIDPRDINILVGKLCSEQRADNLTGRSRLDVAIQWTDDPNELTWRGHFYPAVGDQPAAADIQDWKLYTGDEETLFCNGRVVSPEALEVLSNYEVPIQVSLPSPLQSGFNPLTVSVGLILILVALVFGVIAFRYKFGKPLAH